MKKLDFRNAVRDVRRFNYVCALLDLLIGQQMIALSGCAQKVLLAMLEEVASYAVAHQHNPRGIRRLLNKLRALYAAKRSLLFVHQTSCGCEIVLLRRSSCWGGPLGSQLLWHQNTMTMDRILSTESKMQFGEHSNETYPHFLQLPEECIREIILRLSDHNDLLSSAQACEQMAAIVEEQRVWRELARFHFTAKQIELVAPKEGKTDWKTVYHSLKRFGGVLRKFGFEKITCGIFRTYGLKEEMQFAEMLALCQYCCCLFWRSLGHPCIAEQCPEYRERLEKTGKMLAPSPVPPSAFLKFFSL